MKTLGQLAIGAAAKVVEVTGVDDVAIRLMEMGLVPGTAVRLVGQAPLGDPLELELRGYRLSVRRTEADRIAVTSP
ncbi:MAG: ferrous iron transport protein A [Planctomycetaceae bacterium]|nr:ferrous iron transport protein A [Planctomycetaceae bacterium]